MASIIPTVSVNLLTLSFAMLFLSLPNAVTSIDNQELESMLSTLRSLNYNLFSNAITTSDLLNEVVSGTSSFTFFAPSDHSLFALDMASTASFYTQTLRYHVIPRRLSMSDLRRLPSGSSIRTLLHRRDVHVLRRQSPESDIITVDGVDVVVPGLYYGRDVAVHGLDGILSFRSQNGSRHGSPPPPMVNSSYFPPRTDGDSQDNRTLFPPVPSLSPVNQTILAPLPKLPPVNHTALPPLPKFPPANQKNLPPLPSYPRVNQTTLPPSPSFPPVNQTILPPLPSYPLVNQTIQPPSPSFPPVNQTILPPLPSYPLVNQTILPPSPSFPPVNQTILPPSPSFPPVNRTIISPVPDPPTVDELSPAISPGNQDHSPEISPAPRHLAPQVHPPAALILEDENKAVPTPSIFATTEHSDGNARPMTMGMRPAKRSEVASGVEVAADDIWAMNPPMSYEQEAETREMSAEMSWPLDEETVESQVTDGDVGLDHVSVQAGHSNLFQRYTIDDL